jgi:hypothetical protein
MLKALYCYLTGRHEYAVTCEPGQIFLQCRNCHRRTTGWGLREEHAHAQRTAERAPARTQVRATAGVTARRQVA